MPQVSPKALEEFKQIFKKEYNKEFKSDTEAQEAAQNLLGFFEVLYDVAQREAIRKKRLEKEPKGFHLEEDGKFYSCLLCHETISGKSGWWDELGQKCLNCQRAVNNKIIPKSVFKNRDSWYADWEIKSKFGIHPSTVRKLVREGKLKPRNITTKNGAICFQLFLLKENKNFT